MKLFVIKNSVVGNYEKALAISKNIEPQILVKSFYENLGLLDCFDSARNITVWRNSKKNYPSNTLTLNYKLRTKKSSLDSGGLIKPKNVSYSYEPNEYIPLDLYDGREGFDLEDLENIVKGKKFNICITSGCLDGRRLPLPNELNELVTVIRNMGCVKVSIGGSFYLGYLSDGYKLDVDSIRLGEYILYGTVPNYQIKEKFIGTNSIFCESKVLEIYPRRKEFILDVGYSLLDMQNCVIFGDYKLERYSSEYSIFSYTHTPPKIKSTIKIVPSYKSLIKLKNICGTKI